jgi:hypothetical protein
MSPVRSGVNSMTSLLLRTEMKARAVLLSTAERVIAPTALIRVA